MQLFSAFFQPECPEIPVWFLISSNLNKRDKGKITYGSFLLMSSSLDQPVTKNQILNTKLWCLLLCFWCKWKKRRQPGLFSFRSTQQHKSKHWNLVFSIWLLVTNWSYEKDNTYQSLYGLFSVPKVIFLQAPEFSGW